MSYEGEVLIDGPAAYYRLGEASGGFVDAMGGTSGTANGTMTRDVVGPFRAWQDDGAIDLDGSTGYVSVPDQSQLDLGNSWSLECWFRRDGGDGTFRYLIAKGSGAYAILLGDDNRLYAQVTGVDDLGRTAATFTGSNFHHVVATKNGSTLHIYIDAVEDTVNISNSAVSGDNAVALNIGREPSGGIEPWNGAIDEVAIYDYDLSAARVAVHHAAGLAYPSRPDVSRFPKFPLRRVA